MKKYTLTLNEGQLILLHNLVSTGVYALQTDIGNGTQTSDPILDAEIRIDAFSRGPKLVTLIEEHLALGPEPMMCDEEET